MKPDNLQETCRITLHPQGNILFARPGEILKDALERSGTVFPNNCGGKGICRGCRVEFLSPPPPPTQLEERWFGASSALRMTCQHRIDSDLTLRIAVATDLGCSKQLRNFRLSNRETGKLIAVDLGTTIVAVYLFNLDNGELLGWRNFLNPQLSLGGDVMTRLNAARNPDRLQELTYSVRSRIQTEIHRLLKASSAPIEDVRAATLAGNTAMTHFWRGEPGDGLGRAPFHSELEGRGALAFDPAWLGLPLSCSCWTLPVLAGFIGGDTTAAILAARLDEPGDARLLIDLGTNGEIILTVGELLWATSTAAGPAFEGVGMSAGMPAAIGAIESIRCDGEPVVIGNIDPVGFCGSGYISALAYLLDCGALAPNGLLEQDAAGFRRWTPGSALYAAPCVTQEDVRQFQLAKGAIAAGVEILSREAGINQHDIDRVILTGSFGTSLNPVAAVRLGLIPDLPLERLESLDNAAGRGAAMFGSEVSIRERAELSARRVQVINLGERPDFQDLFVERMSLGKLIGG